MFSYFWQIKYLIWSDLNCCHAPTKIYLSMQHCSSCDDCVTSVGFCCLSNAVHGQNINLPVCVCVCLSVCPPHFLILWAWIGILQAKYAKNSNSYIFRSVYLTDMKFDRQLRPATETSWVVSYGGKTIPRRRTAAIFKIDISPYLSEKSPDFHEILYIAADFELDEQHVIKNEKVTLDRLRVRQNVFLVF